MNTNTRTRGIVAARADASHLQAINDLQKAFAEFKTAHAEALSGKADVVLTEKVDRINAALDAKQAEIDALNAKLASIASATPGERPVADREYSTAFAAHIKRGDVQASMSRGSDPDGGFLAPIEWDRTITDRLKLVSPMRQICRIQTISGTTFSKLFSNRNTASGWVGETAARPATTTGTLGTLQFPTGEIYANVDATQTLLDDSLVNLEAWIASEVDVEFARQEGVAFISGNGTNQPHGLLNYATGGTFATRHPFGAIALRNTGVAAALSADAIINIIHDLPSMYAGGAVFTMNRNTMRQVRLLKDTTNQYLWQPSYQAGQPSTLAGYPVIEMPDLPDVGAGARPIVFGNFAEGYLIIDRTGVRVLRDPYTNKPYVLFYVTKRVGGGVLNPDALKIMNVAV